MWHFEFTLYQERKIDAIEIIEEEYQYLIFVVKLHEVRCMNWRNWLTILNKFISLFLQFSLPMPKGGKHSQNHFTAEDMPMPQQRSTKKSKQKLDVLSMDYVEGMSPFSATDITSRAAQLGIRQGQRSNGGFNRRNPNEGKKHTGKRRK